MKISDNVSPADNQQERLIGWIIGFVDGEGCFSINFARQPDRQEKTRIRRGYKTGYQISHHFAVTQGERGLAALERIKSFFGVGQIYRNRRHDNHKEDLFSYKVGKRADLLKVIIPFFEKSALQTSKRNDFALFAQCVRSMSKKEHLNVEGMVKMARLTQLMNHKKSRIKLIRILRDYTPSSITKGREDIVPSA
ncbi:hypothetical protein A2810_02700 [candidate division Kazan bacterium RIFCSPHIGHO2_01_FULL_49_10]|uniref:Homing endonuclease LAGLIDADG domain-containing protein n=1 Tax=candidate division Kazan bacterium RIFCSPLOWO2_01_FULL_48_13 TaxID=1798539 RepID=A0A1F4PRQ8_UNCK3|nr:MAG: hypothetical protein A2810_02700 [candidate division Kazan bacterium RIFCSPHIGHO2_01_FULL_49_10]OGB85732.1 MAG: hypothetical protein A2994_03185 [candidate division Kazan bacterium RIFCSPLOWO2_01_FULL_48_13]